MSRETLEKLDIQIKDTGITNKIELVAFYAESMPMCQENSYPKRGECTIRFSNEIISMRYEITQDEIFCRVNGQTKLVNNCRAHIDNNLDTIKDFIVEYMKGIYSRFP